MQGDVCKDTGCLQQACVGRSGLQARAIVDHCGLPWEDACLTFHKTERPVRTASSVQVREPVYRSSIGRWRPYETFLQPLIQVLNAGAVEDDGTLQTRSSIGQTLVLAPAAGG